MRENGTTCIKYDTKIRRRIQRNGRTPRIIQQDVVEVGIEPQTVEVEVTQALTNADKIDAITKVDGVEKHDAIGRHCYKGYRQLRRINEFGHECPKMPAGRIFETAGKMLQIAMDSKNAKVDKKLRMIDLQIRKLRLDAMEGTNNSTDGGQVMDRTNYIPLLNKGDK